MRASVLIVIASLAVSLAGRAQGTVNFANAGAGLNAPVYIDTISGALAGTGYMAQLLLDQSGSLVAVGNPANFIGSAAPGYFNGGVITVNLVAPGAIGTFQVLAWDSSTGIATYAAAVTAVNSGLIHGGYSNPVTIATGGVGIPPSAPAALVGLQPWSMYTIPEPPTALLGLLGAGALMLRHTLAPKKQLG